MGETPVEESGERNWEVKIVRERDWLIERERDRLGEKREIGRENVKDRL